MMFVEGLSSQEEGPEAAIFLFLLESSKSPNGLHAFFEGHGDVSFYMNFLRNFSFNPTNIHAYRCGNKKGVYEAYRKIKDGSGQGTTLFFVDKDHSDILSEVWETAPNIYVTDCYSIENYLVSEDMLRRVWIELFHFKHVILEFGTAHRDKFQTELKRFYQFVLPMTAWTIYLRKNGKQPNLNNIKFSRFFRLNDELTLEWSEEVQRLGNEVKLLEQVCGVETPGGWLAEAELITRELAGLDPKTYVRGKLELCFFVKFVEKLLKVLHLHISAKGGSLGTKTPIGEENAIEVLGPRLLIPLSLEKFLQANSPASA